jgi:peptide/nickel transport system ATP-binding protein
VTTSEPAAPATPAADETTLLDIRDLTVSYRTGRGRIPAVRGVSLSVDSGTTLGLAGESGCGKSSVALALLRLLPHSARVGGQVRFRGEDLLAASWGRVRAVRWAGASIVFQGAQHSLNAVHRIGDQIAEPIRLHDRKVTDAVVRDRVGILLEQVGLPRARGRHYPHELSGGQRQRVMIAMALACAPDLIIADEPTTGLDVMIQAQVLTLIQGLVEDNNIGMVMISHDLSVLAQACKRVAVMYAGRIVEEGPAESVFGAAAHPYTKALAAAFPRIGDPASRLRPQGLAGDPPDPAALPTGCPFHPRCAEAQPVCESMDMALWPAGPDRAAACINVLDEKDRPTVTAASTGPSTGPSTAPIPGSAARPGSEQVAG